MDNSVYLLQAFRTGKDAGCQHLPVEPVGAIDLFPEQAGQLCAYGRGAVRQFFTFRISDINGYACDLQQGRHYRLPASYSTGDTYPHFIICFVQE
jgi:hypothetical protein